NYEFSSNIQRASVKPTVVKVLNETGVRTFNESQRRVPVDTGNLKASGRLDAAAQDRLRVVLSYGGTAAQYAAAVHELHATNNKYLETPMRENASRFRRDLVRALGTRMR
ncbi:MAG: hypothetical protein RI554_08055, partial [Trueperaceae bacterium]|nr:hypothetical protein [Trueperaceae bacterium]